MQVNKNVLLKGRVGTDAAVASVAFKAWWQPSFTIGASAGFDMQTRKPVFGFVLNCENYGNMRWAPSAVLPLWQPFLARVLLSVYCHINL